MPITTPLSPTTIPLGATGHDTIHTNDRQKIEEIRSKVVETIDAADVSGTKSVDWVLGSTKDFRLIGATTFSFSTNSYDAGGDAGQPTTIMMRLRQDATGGRTVTWPGSTVIKWPGGAVPTLTTTANAVDWLTFVSIDGGTTWAGFLAGKDLR